MTKHRDDGRIKVMVSSTIDDLKSYRQAVADAIDRHRLIKVRMEDDSAEDKTSIKYSLGLVDQADVYIVILAHRYGYVPEEDNDEQISLTEMEYHRARERGIPVLGFVIDPDHPIPGSKFEDDGEKIEKLKAFRKLVLKEKVVAFFTSEDNLSLLVHQALDVIKGELESTREVPDKTPPPEPADDRRSLPTPPEFYIAHQYIQTRNFIGRAKELEDLDKWAAGDQPLLLVEGIGGLGKSALTWHWVHNHAAEHIPGLAGMVWWSFYASTASFTSFVRNTLAYVTRQPIKDVENLSFDEQVRQLFTVLSHAPYLLVLDGFERMLVAYHRSDAPYRRDEDVEAETQEGDASLLDCIDERHRNFLQRLAQCEQTRTLVSSRLCPTAFRDRDTNQLIPGVVCHKINGLHPDDALTLLQEVGVFGHDPRTMKTFMAEFGYHSLLVGILAGKIINYRLAAGDFDKWLADEGADWKLSELDIKVTRTHILHHAFQGLPPELSLLLSQIAAFRYPVGYEALATLNPYLPPRPEEMFEPEQRLQELKGLLDYDNNFQQDDYRRQIRDLESNLEMYQAAYQDYQATLAAYHKTLPAARSRFHAGLRVLEDRGLLQWDRRTNRYDLHPVVRGYAFEQLEGETRQQTFLTIRDHFDGLPPEDLTNVRDLNDLQHSLQIYHALLGAGLLDQAADCFRERLGKVLAYQLAADPVVVELLTPLFTEGTDRPPTLSGYRRQSDYMNRLSISYSQMGWTEKALQLEQQLIKSALEEEATIYVIVSLYNNHAISLCNDNQLVAAQRTHELARDLAEAAGHENDLATSYFYLQLIYTNTGQWAAAEDTYRRYMEMELAVRETFWQAAAERCWAGMLVARRLEGAADALDRAWELSVQGENAYSQRVTQHLRGILALQTDQPEQAVGYFNRAVRMGRTQGAAQLADHLGGLARARVAQGKLKEARRLIEEALEQPYKRFIHDLYNSAADVYYVLGDEQQARQYALTAYQQAWADGPPYAWWWGLEQAREMLARLGVPEPELPPFDESQVEPVIYEEEIRALIRRLEEKKEQTPQPDPTDL